MLEHSRAQLLHSRDNERRAADHTRDLEHRIGLLETELAMSRDETAKLREELRRSQSDRADDARRSTLATRRCKDLQKDVDSLRSRCNHYQARLAGIESERDKAVATLLAMSASSPGLHSGGLDVSTSATVAVLTNQLLSARHHQEELQVAASREHRRAEALAGKVAALELDPFRSPSSPKSPEVGLVSSSGLRVRSAARASPSSAARQRVAPSAAAVRESPRAGGGPRARKL